jgi:hypothetical protein
MPLIVGEPWYCPFFNISCFYSGGVFCFAKGECWYIRSQPLHTNTYKPYVLGSHSFFTLILLVFRVLCACRRASFESSVSLGYEPRALIHIRVLPELPPCVYTRCLCATTSSRATTFSSSLINYYHFKYTTMATLSRHLFVVVDPNLKSFSFPQRLA